MTSTTEPVSKRNVPWSIPLGLLVVTLAWWGADLWNLATINWAFLERDSDIEPRKLVSLSLFGLIAFFGTVGSIVCLFLALVNWVPLLCFAASYIVFTCIRWI